MHQYIIRWKTKNCKFRRLCEG